MTKKNWHKMAKRPVITYISFLEKIWDWGEKLSKSSLNTDLDVFLGGRKARCVIGQIRLTSLCFL